MNLPQDFQNKMTNLLGDESHAFFEALDKPQQKGITVNYARMEENVFLQNFDNEIEKIPLVDNGYYVGNFKFADNIFNHLGVIYSQEPSAMYPVEMLDIKEGDRVLDVCASPGGKSIQILEKLNGTGILVSNEIVFKRAKILQENISRMGFDNCIITCNSPEDFENIDCQFDRILVDAPCGGEGMIRKANFDIDNYSPNAIDTNAKRQLKILNSVKHLLKDGGRLVYSTCTYDIRENEGVIAQFLKDNNDFEIINKNEFLSVCDKGIKIENFDTQLALRRYPHKCRGEGQFMIALVKKSTSAEIPPPKTSTFKNYCKISNKERNIINDTFRYVVDTNHMEFVKKDNFIFTIPQTKINTFDLNVMYPGTFVGEIKQGILKVSHEFYHTFGKNFYHKIDLDHDQANKYLRGEELSIDEPNNIYAVTYLSTALGGGKAVNGRLKNYYSKDLRIK